MVASEELEGKLHENRVKQITGDSFVTFRNMYEQNTGGIPNAKIFVTTNNYPECKASEAFKDRVVAKPFDAEFVDHAPKSTSQQVKMSMLWKTAIKDVFSCCIIT
jgi:phage/plasmid-associated DNA primase